MKSIEKLEVEDLSELRQLAIDAAQEAAQVVLKYFKQSSLHVERKQDDSPVTEADREAERCIRETLTKYSSVEPIDILGEEYGSMGTGARLRWTIDPIDGTRSFVNGVPLFGTIIALEDTVERQALVGVIHLPVFNMTYSAARGCGSWCDESQIRVSSSSRIEEVIVSAGDPLQFVNAQFQGAYRHLLELCPCLRGYTDCFGHTLVASGAVGAMLDPDLNPWDVTATQVLIEEAGGVMMIRPSVCEGKVDALFGNADLVKFLAKELKF